MTNHFPVTNRQAARRFLGEILFFSHRYGNRYSLVWQGKKCRYFLKLVQCIWYVKTALTDARLVILPSRLVILPLKPSL